MEKNLWRENLGSVGKENKREYNGVAERGLTIIEYAALAARLQPSKLFPGYIIPEGPSLWAEAMNWDMRTTVL